MKIVIVVEIVPLPSDKNRNIIEVKKIFSIVRMQRFAVKFTIFLYADKLNSFSIFVVFLTGVGRKFELGLLPYS